MKTALAILVSFAALSCAQDRKPADEGQPHEKKRLQSVTWDLKRTSWSGSSSAAAKIKGNLSPMEATATKSRRMKP